MTDPYTHPNGPSGLTPFGMLEEREGTTRIPATVRRPMTRAQHQAASAAAVRAYVQAVADKAPAEVQAELRARRGEGGRSR